VSFWIIAVALTLLAIGFVIVPLLWLRKGFRQQEVAADLVSIALIKEQLDELELQSQTDFITEGDYQERKRELELRLVADAMTAAEVPSKGQYRAVLTTVALLVPLASWLLYHQWGSAEAWQLSQRYQAVSAQLAKGEGNSDQAMAFVADLAHYTQQGGSADWLFLQAQLYMQMGAYQAAADSYARVAAQQPGSAEVLARQAQAQYLASGRKLDSQVKQLVEQVLAINPHQPTVLGMRGMDAFERADYAMAIGSWEQAIRGMPPGSQSAQVLQQGIVQARKALAESGVAGANLAAGEPQPSDTAGFSDGIKVRVELDQQAIVSPGATVFVIAQAPEGGMPFAVVRLPVEGLPADVVLDDSTAMAPGNSLSKQARAKVTARVSVSGNAMAQAGDWQGRSQILTPDTLPELVAIRIDQEI
jgi:cytochrome c-type biogenesis protein CcmH